MTEPLAPLARFAFDWANTLCDPNHSCSSYHRMWPFVRLIETGGALPAGQEFFHREVQTCSRDGKVHAIISGGADTGVMALAVEGALKDGLDLRITAVDRCRTPLEQMRLYGAANSIEVDIHAITLDQIPAGLDADIILGHTILTQIPAEGHLAVFQAWSDALRPGGRIVMSQRLATHDETSHPRWTPDLVATRRQGLQAKLEAMETPNLSASKETILDAAEHFWTRAHNRSNVFEEEIYAHAEVTNLRVLQMEPIMDTSTVSPFSFTKLVTQRLRYEIVLEKPTA